MKKFLFFAASEIAQFNIAENELLTGVVESNDESHVDEERSDEEDEEGSDEEDEESSDEEDKDSVDEEDETAKTEHKSGVDNEHNGENATLNTPVQNKMSFMNPVFDDDCLHFCCQAEMERSPDVFEKSPSLDEDVFCFPDLSPEGDFLFISVFQFWNSNFGMTLLEDFLLSSICVVV